MTLKHTIITTAVILTACCQQPSINDPLLQDYDSFFSQLEEIHPDPYTAFGGEHKFRRAVADLRKELASRDSLTLNEMQYEVNAFLSTLHDGHTRMGWSDVPNIVENAWLPLNFRVIPDGIIVNAVAPDLKEFAGARVNKVNGVSLEEILKRLSRIVITENHFGLLNQACDYLRNTNTIRAICPDFNAVELTFGLRLADGRDTLVSFPFYKNDSPVWDTFIYPQRESRLPRGNHQFAFTDDTRTTMYYRMSSVMSADVPDCDDPHVVAEVFQDMLTQMKEAASTTLIIDLRGNGGGYTPIIYAALYELYGDAFLHKDLGVTYRTKISEAYLRKNNTTLDSYNARNGTTLQLGDFLESGSDIGTIDYFMCNRKDILFAQNGEPIYTPETVYVVTNARTFSAAFHFTYFLSQMGAKIVGVPSGQAPNTFMEGTLFTLPNSGLTCQASNSTQVIFSSDDPRAHTLWPDIMLTYDDYRELFFNQDAEILYLLK